MWVSWHGLRVKPAMTAWGGIGRLLAERRYIKTARSGVLAVILELKAVIPGLNAVIPDRKAVIPDLIRDPCLLPARV